MLLLIAAMALTDPAPTPFPEHVPGLIEACLANAIETGEVSETDDSHKYTCTDEAAERFWTFLERANVHSYEQNAGEDGYWLSRDFPLGGCFKRVRMPDGTPATWGLSCSIRIPRPAR
jgi:hypothetical protein